MSKKLLVAVLIVASALGLISYSLLRPQYVERDSLWAKYPNRRCRCYGLHLAGETKINYAADPSHITPEACIGIQIQCEAMTEHGWSQEAYQEVVLEERRQR